MRVISQAGLGMDYDIPYEEAVIKRYGEVILCASKHLDREATIAKYSTEAKAIKAMEMLREAYVGKLRKTKQGNVMIDFEASHIFHFPKDENVEVEDE